MTIAMTSYPEGTLVTVRGLFTNSAGAAQDPSVVKLTVTEPDGTTTTYIYLTDDEVTKSATGDYRSNLDTTGKKGMWIYIWWATGTGQSDSGEHVFYVE